jgi:polyisoprenoid-binding protein YceI
MRRLLLLAAGAVVVVVAGVVAAFVVRGSDEPPPPSLSRQPTATADATGGATEWHVAPGESSFVGYRVRERFIAVGVADAVGRTGDVSGTVEVDGDRLRAARLEANLATLRSDEARRDNALRERGIETARFPTAAFRLTTPFELSRRGANARGELTLHGRTKPVRVDVRGQRLADDAIEVAGSAPIAFDRFGIEPPSIAGFVTVEDEGTLEFRLRLRPR